VNDTDSFSYPDSTVFVKTFLHVVMPGDTIYWETRFLVKKSDPGEYSQNWWGFSYRWNTAQTDANLVDVDLGGNGVLAIRDAQGHQTYRKWRFPSQADCNLCHQVTSGSRSLLTGIAKESRGVLGFFPAQLKKPTPNGVSNQVLDLFTAGVFSGTKPAAADLAKRFIGVSEPIDPTLTPAQKSMVIDTMARSYLAANCSGCHGDRASEIGTSPARIPPNFDYFDFRQHSEPFDQIPASVPLNDTTAYTDSLTSILTRNKFKWLVSSWGMSSDPNWNLALPPGNPDTLSTKVVYSDPVTHKGYPSLSYMLFRQWSRSTPATDSAAWYQGLTMAAGFGDANAQAKLGWLFAKPWGTQAWIDNLAAHQFTLDSVMAGLDGKDLYRNDPDGMPPLATYIPDTAALKILGAWVAQPSPNSAVRAVKRAKLESPVIRNRILNVYPGYTGTVEMADLRGRTLTLKPVGNGRYAIPDGVKEGVFFFRIGDRYYKGSVLR